MEKIFLILLLGNIEFSNNFYLNQVNFRFDLKKIIIDIGRQSLR